jgi:hypothetical protein
MLIHNQRRAMKAAVSSETPVSNYQTTWCHIPEDLVLIYLWFILQTARTAQPAQRRVKGWMAGV